MKNYLILVYIIYIYIYIEYENNLDLLLGIQGWRRFFFIDEDKHKKLLYGTNGIQATELIGGQGRVNDEENYNYKPEYKYNNFSKFGIDMSQTEKPSGYTGHKTAAPAISILYIYIYI